jgi:hypothetical protein
MDPRHELLNSFVARKFARIEEFRTQNPTVWLAADLACVSVEGLLSAVASDMSASDWSMVDSELFLMWQDVYQYQSESLFLIIDHCFNEGYALIRMATELVRDAACIADNGALLEVRKRRLESRESRNDYRKAFKFREDRELEAYVKRLYDLASDYSVHGHLLGHISRKPAQSSGVYKGYTLLTIPEEAVHQQLLPWLMGFFPMQQICASKFVRKKGPAVLSALSVQAKVLADVFVPFVEQFSKSVAETRSSGN